MPGLAKQLTAVEADVVQHAVVEIGGMEEHVAPAAPIPSVAQEDGEPVPEPGGTRQAGRAGGWTGWHLEFLLLVNLIGLGRTVVWFGVKIWRRVAADRPW